MKALSIQQPYAWLIVNGHKDIENRDWSVSYRGQILIHAGKHMDTTALPRPHTNYQFYLNNSHWHDVVWKMPKNERDYRTGGIVGIATLVDCVTKSKSPWFRGLYGFVLKDARLLPFVPLRGKLGLFDVEYSLPTPNEPMGLPQDYARPYSPCTHCDRNAWYQRKPSLGCGWTCQRCHPSYEMIMQQQRGNYVK